MISVMNYWKNLMLKISILKNNTMMKIVNMKKAALIFTLLISMNIYRLQAQDGERLEQLRIAFLTEQLDLGVAEGQSFWPIYNEFNKSKQALDKQRKEAMRVVKEKGDAVSEKEIRDAIAKVHQTKTEEENLEKKFIEDCLPVLGPAKTGKLMMAEHEFKRQMMERLKERREGEHGGPGRRN